MEREHGRRRVRCDVSAFYWSLASNLFIPAGFVSTCNSSDLFRLNEDYRAYFSCKLPNVFSSHCFHVLQWDAGTKLLHKFAHLCCPVHQPGRDTSARIVEVIHENWNTSTDQSLYKGRSHWLNTTDVCSLPFWKVTLMYFLKTCNFSNGHQGASYVAYNCIEIYEKISPFFTWFITSVDTFVMCL